MHLDVLWQVNWSSYCAASLLVPLSSQLLGECGQVIKFSLLPSPETGEETSEHKINCVYMFVIISQTSSLSHFHSYPSLGFSGKIELNFLCGNYGLHHPDRAFLNQSLHHNLLFHTAYLVALGSS